MTLFITGCTVLLKQNDRISEKVSPDYINHADAREMDII